MIRNKQNRIIRWTLQTYVRWIVRKHFHTLVFEPVTINPGKSVLFIANHFSYWDSLILFIVNQKLFGKKFHVMAREDTTVALRFVKYGGAFTVKKNSRDMLKSLDYAIQLLNDPQNMVLLFPQGKLHANFVNRVNFEKGIMRIVNAAGDKCQIVFAATFIQYLLHKKPTATIYLQTESKRQSTLEQLTTAYQKFYDNKRTEQLEIVIST